MAKALSQVYTTIRGSVGGVTYTANQWHAIVARARVAPVNPSTPNQGIIRSALAQASSSWKQLVQATREAWDDYANTCEYTGPLGNYTVPGRQMFIACIAFARYIDARGLYVLTILPTAPTVPGFFSPGPLNPVPPTGPGTGIGLSISNQTGEDGVALIERSYAFPTSRERYKGPFLSASAQAILCSTGTSTVIEFLGLQADYVYFTRVRLVTAVAPFRVSAEYIFRHIAETVP